MSPDKFSMTAAAVPPPDERTLQMEVARDADSPQAHAALASFLCDAGRLGDALAHIDREIARQPSRIWPLSIKAGILSGARRAAEALEVHRSLVAMAPDIPLLWANFGGDLAAVGEVDEAALAFRKTLDLAPESGVAWLGLANLHGAPCGEADIAAMETGLALARDPYQKVQLLLALGRAHEALGSFDRSFEKFGEANALRNILTPYDGTGLAAFVEAHQALPASFFRAAAPGPTPENSGAIFIVGMPRSGSTLVEQILASHPEIEGMGELFALQEVAASMSPFDAPDAFVQRLQTLTQAEAARLGTQYLARGAQYRRTGRPYFTDKMPANWRFVALIHRILPGARIIDIRRDPMDCCFSAYTTYFNRHTDFPNTLDELGGYYRHYRRMIDMAHGLAPDGLYQLEHAQLLSNAEREIRALLGFLRLPFSPSCLRHEENARPVYTPSAQQVRAPIHRKQRRSQDYLPWLKPLQAALDAG